MSLSGARSRAFELRSSSSVSGREWSALVPLCLVLLGVVWPAATTWAGDAALLPRNDDWSYRSISLAFFESGQLRLDGASQSFAIGQVLLTQPLLHLASGDPIAFFWFGVASSLVAVLAGYALARRFLTVGDSAIVVVTLVIGPAFLAYASSYMTDVPALAGQLLCLYLGARAVASKPISVPWALAAIACGVFAFSVRQFAIAAPAAVAVTALWLSPRRGAFVVVASMVGGLMVAVLTSALAGQVGSTPIIPGGTARAGAAVITIGVAMLPVTLLSLWRRRASGNRATMAVGIGTAIAIAVASGLSHTAPAALGNAFTAWGDPAQVHVAGVRPLMLAPEVWAIEYLFLLTAIPLGAAVAHAAIDLWRAFGGSIRRREAAAAPLVLLGGFVVVAAGGVVAYALGFAVFSRYLWPVVIPLGILLLVRSKAESPVTAASAGASSKPALLVWAAVVVGFAAIATASMLNSVAFERARWNAGLALVEAGYPPSQVDAGYEWLGVHGPGSPRVHDRQIRPSDPLAWYGNIWPDFDRCAFVSGDNQPFDGFELLQAQHVSYEQYLVLGPRVPLHLYVSTD